MLCDEMCDGNIGSNYSNITVKLQIIVITDFVI